jgi:peptidoglycan pentaglycine glycine transferase (the first glycine)
MSATSRGELAIPGQEHPGTANPHPQGVQYVRSVIARASRWDPLMAGRGGSFLQSWRWGEFKGVTGWSPYRAALYPPGVAGVLRESRSGEGSEPEPLVCGQVLFRSVPRLPVPVSVAYVPRGPVLFAGALRDPYAERAFWRAVHAECKRRGAIFLKVEPDAPLDAGAPDNANHAGERLTALGFHPAGRLQPQRTWVLDIGASEDDLLKGMKPKTRYNIRLAGRRGVQVYQASTMEHLRGFHSLLQVTGERDEFGIHDFRYYEQLWRIFGPEGDNTMLLLLADHPDEAERAAGPIAGLAAFRFGRQAIYMYGASDNRGREHMPNYLLQWEAIRWAKAHGCTVYDFWGIPDAPAEEGEDGGTGGGGEVSPTNTRSGLGGVYWFKKGFGGRAVEYPGAYDYVYNPLLYRVWLRWRGAGLG